MCRKSSFVYPPSGSAADSYCFAALCEMGIGNGRAAVIDYHTGRAVHFQIETVTLIRNVACVRCESLRFADGVHEARLPDGQVVGVRDARDVFEAGEAAA